MASAGKGVILPAVKTLGEEVTHRCCVGDWIARLRMAALIPAVGKRECFNGRTDVLVPVTSFS